MLKNLLSMAAGAALAVTATSALAEDPTTVNFGIISTESSSNLKTQWVPFLEDMQAALNMPVKPFFASDYAGIIEGMRFKKVHVAWFGNKSAMEAVDRAGAEIFVQQVDISGRPGYWSLLITHKDSGIKTLDDVLENPGKYTFGNGDPNSTSGFLIPSFYLWQKNKIDVKQHFTRVVNGSHEVNALAVANRQVDVATNNTESLFDPDNPAAGGRFIKQRPEMAKNVRVLWKSPLIPSDPMVYHKELSAELKAKMKAFFLGYGRIGPKVEKEKAVLAGIGAGLAPFKDSSNDQLIPIREIELAKDRNKLLSDDRLDKMDKEKKLAEIDGKLDMLRKRSEMLTN